MIKSWLQVSVKLTWNNHGLSSSSSSSSSHAHICVMSASFLGIWFYCFESTLFITCCVSRQLCANDWQEKRKFVRTDNRWYCLMMCYSFFFFYHYQLFSSSILCCHVRVSYASIAIRSMGCGLSLSSFIYIYRKQKQRIHNTTPSVDLTLTRRQSDTFHSTVQTRTIDVTKSYLSLFLLLLFTQLVWSSLFTQQKRCASMNTSKEIEFIRDDTSIVYIYIYMDGKEIKKYECVFTKCVKFKYIFNNSSFG